MATSLRRGAAAGRARRALLLLLPPALFALAGCTTGLLYTDVVEPLTDNFRANPLGTKTGCSDLYRLKDPVTGVGASAEWASLAIADAARQGGITKIYHADLRTFSVLFGLFRRQTVLVYGD